MAMCKNINTEVDETALQFTAEYNENGERVCTCGSGRSWVNCPGMEGDISYCG